MKQGAIIFMGLLVMFGSGCKEEEVPPAKELKYTNLSYGDDPAQKYDLYLPEGRDHNTKLLIFVHGGGWSEGDKSDFTAILATLEGNGFAIANINYRLANIFTGVLHPQPADDVRLAVDYLIGKAGEYKISSEDIVLAGHSAGGHLVLYTALALNDDVAIKGVVSMCGPTDLEDPYYQSIFELSLLLTNYIGFTYADNPALYAAASPVNLVTSASVPMLLEYGVVDDIVPISNGASMESACVAASADFTYLSYPTYGHELGSGTFGLPADVKQPIIDFIDGI
jgi:acetyl esterase/lipase